MTSTHAIYPDLAGKVVAVTGGASGIGAAIVTAFHNQGAHVVFFDKDELAGAALAESLGNRVHFRALDLTDIEALTNRFAETAAMVGDFDVLVNNAARDDRHEIASVTPAYWREQLAVNLDHQFFSTQAVIPGMRKKGAGAIVNMSSIAWRVGLESAPAYVASKAAIEGLTHSLARELGPAGIRVNCLLPGFVRTQRQVDNWLTPEFEQRIKSSQCLTSFIEPEDIAEMVIMLTSDASRAVTNQTLVVDAGWT
ncbi:SDR family NAD(P)-dependent oxidoreductase [Granulosicoccus antarcticus]|uniref:D-xylose 1-dehydrogenase n=1 Tax=Granulosicoccus antarcticus IMCC3135 TaxID=1192854 RepID=A0A2Z2NPR7_9GAMM|nr:SDR family oxidoreductase [Granulosicoccus antarcticus]ASJ73422.1 D-xylose 1-dehydrogenase [Granulosicoccus antarcticus IMCC3135]